MLNSLLADSPGFLGLDFVSLPSSFASCVFLKLIVLFLKLRTEIIRIRLIKNKRGQGLHMYCEQREKNGTTILDCFGRFDETDTNQFVLTLEKIQEKGIRHIILNFSPIYYLDPKVVSLLIFAQQFVEAHSGIISLVSPLSSVRNELIRGKIHDAIPTFESMYDAMHRPHSAYVECSD
jgi:anti-anti-sigma regulatory factor